MTPPSTPPATIPDIAKHAGVGTATVDRVLNGRAGVNAQTMEKVMQAVLALGKPPASPGRPRLRSNLRFAYVLPDSSSSFVDQLDRQIAHAASDFRHQHITSVTHRFDASDPARFAADLEAVSDCDGIALLAPDAPAVKLAINAQVRKGVQVVTVFSDVAGSQRAAHVGADSRASGRTAGLLLARMANAPGRSNLLLLSQATRFSAEIEQRIGFAQVLEERFPHLGMARLPDLASSDEAVCKALVKHLKTADNAQRTAGIYCVGTASAGVAKALQGLSLTQSVGVVAHHANDANRAMLMNGSLSFVLHQDMHYSVLAAARVLRALRENVRGAISVAQPGIEILTAENLH